MTLISWLPDLIELEDFSGNWDKYCEGMYSVFSSDFKNGKVEFRGNEIHLRIYPFEQGKEASFWHCISEGKIEADRKIDMDRCKRIRWPRPMIDHDGDIELKIWQNIRHGYLNYCILADKERYLVVIRKYKGKWRLWTTYLATYTHTYDKWIKEYNEYLKNNAAV